MSEGKEIRTKGFLLKSVPYHETSSIATILTEDGFLSFRASGVYKKNSHYLPLFNLMAESYFLLKEGKGDYLLFKEGELLSFPKGNLEMLLAYSFLGEITWSSAKGIDGKELYPYLALATKFLKEGKDPLSIVTSYLAICLRLMGYGLTVDHCVLCGKEKGIVGVSFEEGGFICHDEKREGAHYGKTYCQVAYFTFKVDKSTWTGQNLPREDTLLYFKDLTSYYTEQLGKKIEVLSMFFDVLNG